ncbi:MAG: DUF6159 family protein [Chloroflexota bacterium]
MFSTWGRSWQLVKASWAVLQADKELLWFPVISGIVTMLISLVMLIPAIAVSITLFSTGANDGVNQTVGIVGLFIFYFVTYGVGIYFNTALVGAAMIRLDGGDPTLSDGFGIANSRLGSILGFAAMSATVGVILRTLEERGGIVGDIVSFLGGVAWGMASFLVIPVIVAQDVNAWQGLKTSARLLRETWGEQITGNFSIGGVFFVGYLLIIVLGVGLGILVGSLFESTALVIGIVSLVVFALIALAVLQGAITGIYQATLYRYAESGVAPDMFDIDLIKGAFKPKRKRG